MTTPRCLTIAGSDSGGGAGIQADLKAFAAAGCFGTSAIVALTAQNTLGVTAVQELPPGFVEAQLEAVFADIGVDAAKTGMLFSRELIDTVAGFLAEHRVPLVVDPVMVASSGAKLLRDDAVDHLFDGVHHVEIEVERHDVAATHGAGCTHSATLAALLAKGAPLGDSARTAAHVASEAVRNGLVEIGAGEGPVNVFA
jgi:hydroxymethylpyrimidine/phosphomethylpyrimidine kinase